MRKHVLICAFRARERLTRLMAGHELTAVTTLREACAALKENKFDLILVSVRFDESRLFDLLRYVKADGRLARIPVACLYGLTGSTATPLTLEAMCLACEALGADFHYFVEYADDETGNTRIREILNSYLDPRAQSHESIDSSP
jgi:CheY-like chemotaxis protein